MGGVVIPRADFPVRPVLQAGESLTGYVCRVHWSNGYLVQRSLVRAVEALYGGSDVAVNFDFVEKFIGKGGRLDHNWWVTRRLDGAGTGTPFPKWRRLRFGRLQLCPECIASTGLHLALWEMPLVQACPFHGCILVNRCEQCGCLLSLANLPSGWVCRCGRDAMSAAIRNAPAWKIQLAGTVAQAFDMVLPSHFRPALGAGVEHSRRYSLHAVYNFLHTIHNARVALRRRNPYRFVRWPAQSKRVSRLEPGAWEVRFLSGETSLLSQLTERLLLWSFRGKQSCLVTSNGDDALDTVKQHLSASDHESDVFTAVLNEAVRQSTAMHRAPFGLPGRIYFHPRLSESDRQTRVVRLAAWWHQVARRIPQLAEEHAHPGLRDRFEWVYAMRSADIDVVDIFNLMFSAADRGYDPAGVDMLIHRWQVPRRLQIRMAPWQMFSEIGAYLLQLSHAERAFLLELLSYTLKSSSS